MDDNHNAPILSGTLNVPLLILVTSRPIKRFRKLFLLCLDCCASVKSGYVLLSNSSC